MITTDITTVKASKIRGKWLKRKIVPHYIGDRVDFFDSINVNVIHENFTLDRFKKYDDKTQARVWEFYRTYVQGWKEARGYTLTIDDAEAYIRANLGLK